MSDPLFPPTNPKGLGQSPAATDPAPMSSEAAQEHLVPSFPDLPDRLARDALWLVSNTSTETNGIVDRMLKAAARIRRLEAEVTAIHNDRAIVLGDGEGMVARVRSLELALREEVARKELAEARVARLLTLERWKAEAMEVMSGWERVWEALGRPGVYGSSKYEASLAEVKALQGQKAELWSIVERYQRR